MGIDSGRHQDIHPRPLPRHVADDVAQDGGSGQDHGLAFGGDRDVFVVHRTVPAPASRRSQNNRRQQGQSAQSASHVLPPSPLFANLSGISYNDNQYHYGVNLR